MVGEVLQPVNGVRNNSRRPFKGREGIQTYLTSVTGLEEACAAIEDLRSAMLAESCLCYTLGDFGHTNRRLNHDEL